MLTFTLPLFQSSYGLYGFYGFIEGGSKFITLSVSERKAVFLVATCRFSMSKTPFLFWQCKGTKNPDAKQAFSEFFSDLFQMLKWRTKQEQSQTILLVWAMPCKEEFDEVKCKESRMTAFTVLRSYTVTQFHLPVSEVLRRAKRAELERHFLMDIYIILLYIIYYIYNIKYFFLPKVTAQLHLMQLRNGVTV